MNQMFNWVRMFTDSLVTFILVLTGLFRDGLQADSFLLSNAEPT